MEKRITDFLQKHHVLTLATCNGLQPWCANCFYTFVEDRAWLVFTSDESTRHISEAVNNALVAGSVVLETNIVGKIQGIQFSGTVREAADDELSTARSAYLKRFPFAVVMNTKLWILEIHHLKMTDNRLGFGKKLRWDNPKFITE
jgi:uncharacterized protein YhbP (UPF0306 family)